MSLMLMGISIATLLAIYSNSLKFRFYMKYLIFVVLTSISTTIFIPLMLFRPMDPRNALYPAWAVRQISKMLQLKWNLVGKENIVKDSGCVILINHQSNLDLIVLAEIWPVMNNCTVISKNEVFYYWPFGLAAWLWGTVFIDRSDRHDSQTNINQAAATIKLRKGRVCIFPEGTRHGGDTFLPFKKGAFHIAIEMQAPIQPVVVSKYHWLNCETNKFDPGTNTIGILPCIETKGKTKNDIDELMRETYSVMLEKYKSLSNL